MTPTLLEASDDTADSAADWAYAEPAPITNAGDSGSAPPSTDPALLRNDEVTGLAPRTPPFDSIFSAGALDALGPNGLAEAGECGLESLNGSGDDDDNYRRSVTPPFVEPELAALGDAGRPLIFYELDDPALKGLKLAKSGGQIELSW